MSNVFGDGVLYGVYAMYDKTAKQSMSIFEALNDAVAMRSYEGMMRNPQFAVYAKEISLRRVALYDKAKGVVVKVFKEPVEIEIQHLLDAAEMKSLEGVVDERK